MLENEFMNSTVCQRIIISWRHYTEEVKAYQANSKK